ncbi:MAG: hypothetical protein LBJ10_00240 [Clostridiales bacterium]|jgi:hypothetical protein|nr:hypothetical protein [Clostridiales bacterium]
MMGKTSNSAKQKWNAEHYAQIKAVVRPEAAGAFKAACAASGRSVNSVLSEYIEGFAGRKGAAKPKARLRVATRPERRKTAAQLLASLREVRDAESLYLENIPENLQGGERYEQASQCVDALDEAIDQLEGAF